MRIVLMLVLLALGGCKSDWKRCAVFEAAGDFKVKTMSTERVTQFPEYRVTRQNPLTVEWRTTMINHLTATENVVAGGVVILKPGERMSCAP